MHVRATANTGATREDICEAFLHVAIYAGVPAANRAIKVAKEVFAEMDAERRRRWPLTACPTASRRPAPSSSATATWHPPALHAGLQDHRAALAAARAAVLRQHAVGDHRPGVRPRHSGRARQRPDPQFRQARRERDRRAHHRLRPRARRARPGRCRARCSSSGRPMPAAATATRRTAIWRRSIRISAAAAAPSPTRTAATRSAPSSPAPTPGRTAPTTGARRISISRCSATASRSG